MTSSTIKFFTDITPSARLEYVLDFVFGEVLDANIQICSLDSYDSNGQDMAILYSRKHHGGNAVHIYQSGWLNFNLAEPHPWRNADLNQELSADGKGFDFSKDIFAEIFYHLSRAEEYDKDIPRDLHGRFQGSQSFLHRSNQLESAPVDAYIDQLKNLLSSRFSPIDYREEFRFIPTYDVDFAWKFKNKSLKQHLRSLGGDLFKLRVEVFAERMRTLLFNQRDPYDIWSEVFSWHRDKRNTPIFFLLLSDYSKYDPETDHQHPQYLRLLSQLNQEFLLGIHPGYRSNEDRSVLEKEFNRYHECLDAFPVRSRQHYLKLDLPSTYRTLSELGIKEDYSMVYADQIGFRAGTSHPFFWYDLEKEEKTALKVFPTAFMEVTMKKYLGLKTEDALEKMINIERLVRKYSGTLVSLWHNSSFYEKEGWGGWKETYKAFLSRF